jgi:epoxyqueuosine reductase
MDHLKTGGNNNWPSNLDTSEHSGDAQKLEWQEKFAKSDADAGIEVTENFERFNQINDMFTRAFWDETVRTKKAMHFSVGTG